MRSSLLVWSVCSELARSPRQMRGCRVSETPSCGACPLILPAGVEITGGRVQVDRLSSCLLVGVFVGERDMPLTRRPVSRPCPRSTVVIESSPSDSMNSRCSILGES